MKIKITGSIWWKLSLYFLGIIFLTLIIFGIGISVTMRDLAGGPYWKLAGEKTRKIAAVIAASNDGDLAKAQIPFSSLGKLSGVSLFILNPDGTEASASRSDIPIEIKLTDDETAKLRNGEDVIKLKTSADPDKRILYCASPIMKDGKMTGSVLMAAQAAAPSEVRRKMSKAIFRSFIVAAFFSSLAALFLAGTLTKPVRKMEETAREVAKGNFSRRLMLKRNDELGALGTSLDEMSEKLEDSELQRNRLISDISHEIRTPLATIQGCSEAILDGVVETDDERSRYLRTIRDETARISILLQDLTEISRFEAGETKLENEPFSVEKVVNKALSTVEIFAINRNITLKSDIPPEKITAMGDEARIQQALVILMDNAINHIPEGREVKIVVNRVGKLVRFCVSDNGDGIPEEDLPHVFERLFKADKSRTRKKTGSGLGLAIAKQIIKGHGSDISVRSSSKGTDFSFELPLSIKT